jgi:H+-translocating NAD(P) transhydrogenase subunit beta
VNPDAIHTLIEIAYIIAAIFFIVGIKKLGNAQTARQGNRVSAIGMLIAVVATLASQGMSFQYIAIGIVIGTLIGGFAAARVQMTSMPEFVALFNGTGGLASLLVGWAEYQSRRADWVTTIVNEDYIAITAIYIAIFIGGLTFTGSIIAYLKLSEKIDGKPVLYTGQQIVNTLLIFLVIGCGTAFIMNPAEMYTPLLIGIILALLLGVLFTIPVGGADMPVVISLLNSYSGLAASAAGFVIGNTVLIVSGSLVGASGLILTSIMCKAMNRSLSNVLFSGFGSGTTASKSGAEVQGEAKPISAEDAYYVLEAASNVIFVPGYGMAVAQAQHAVRELADILEENGCEVKYAVHPVAGRMPGHMNVLLAEANVPYEQLFEMDDVNPVIEKADVVIVIGANDVVNPAAREDESSPIYGMPIINVDYANTVFVLKRSMKPGFAGVENPLFYKDNTRMLFGDAKQSIEALITAFKS